MQKKKRKKGKKKKGKKEKKRKREWLQKPSGVGKKNGEKKCSSLW